MSKTKFSEILKGENVASVLDLLDVLQRLTGSSKSSDVESAADEFKDKIKANGYTHVHVVKEGDTLWSISKKYLGTGSRWNEIYERNRDHIKDPDLIYPNQSMEVFVPCTNIDIHRRAVTLGINPVGSPDQMLDQIMLKVRADAIYDANKFVADQLKGAFPNVATHLTFLKPEGTDPWLNWSVQV